MSGEAMEPVSLPSFDHRPDIRLIAADLDGTLLDDEKELHEHFWPLVDALVAREFSSARPAGASTPTSTTGSGRSPMRWFHRRKRGVRGKGYQRDQLGHARARSGAPPCKFGAGGRLP
jgi:hypothetical protein